MKRDYLCEFERKHPWLFGFLLALAAVLLYAAVDDSSALFAFTGRSL